MISDHPTSGPMAVVHLQIFGQILWNAGGSRRADRAVGSGQGDCHACYSPSDNQHGMFLCPPSINETREKCM